MHQAIERGLQKLARLGTGQRPDIPLVEDVALSTAVGLEGRYSSPYGGTSMAEDLGPGTSDVQVCNSAGEHVVSTRLRTAFGQRRCGLVRRMLNRGVLEGKCVPSGQRQEGGSHWAARGLKISRAHSNYRQCEGRSSVSPSNGSCGSSHTKE